MLDQLPACKPVDRAPQSHAQQSAHAVGAQRAVTHITQASPLQTYSCFRYTLRNGEFRTIEVRLVAPTGKELRITDEKGKRVRYQVVHKQGYVAPREVE